MPRKPRPDKRHRLALKQRQEVTEPDTTQFEFEAPVSFAKAGTVTLLVGPDEIELVVHEDCITGNSDFFKAALEREWIEGQTRTIKLPEESCVETMTQYLKFTYLQTLPTERITPVPGDGFKVRAYGILASLYVLGERLLDKAVQNAVVGEILRLSTLTDERDMKWYPGVSAITKIYDGTTKTSPARRLMVDLWVAHGGGDWVEDVCHPAFLADLSRGLFANITVPTAGCIIRDQELIAEHYFT